MKFSKLLYITIASASLTGISFNANACLSRAMLEEYESKKTQQHKPTTNATNSNQKVKEQKAEVVLASQQPTQEYRPKTSGSAFIFHSKETM